MFYAFSFFLFSFSRGSRNIKTEGRSRLLPAGVCCDVTAWPVRVLSDFFSGVQSYHFIVFLK